MMPLVSVLMPFYNCERTLAEAVDSVLAQSMDDFELLLINDGSTDTSPRIATSYAAADSRIRLLGDDANLGLVDRLNQSIEMADGAFIARMDGDDVSYPHRFAVELAYLEKRKDVLAVSSAHRRIDRQGVVIGRYQPSVGAIQANAREVPAREPYLPHPLMMIRTATMKDLGAYRHVLHAEDADLCWRLHEAGKIIVLPDELGMYRVHGEGVSAVHESNRRLQSVYSQLAAISAQRRCDGLTDLEFSSNLAKAATEYAGAFDTLIKFMTQQLRLDEYEKRYLTVSSVVKYIQTASWRAFDLEAGDIGFARNALRFGRGTFTDRQSYQNIRKAYKKAFLRLWQTNHKAEALGFLGTYIQLKSGIGRQPGGSVL